MRYKGGSRQQQAPSSEDSSLVGEAMNDPASTSIDDLLRLMDADSCTPIGATTRRRKSGSVGEETASNVPISELEYRRDLMCSTDCLSRSVTREAGSDKRFLHFASGSLSLVGALVFHLTFGIDAKLYRYIDVVQFQSLTAASAPEVVFTVDTNLVMMSFFLFRTLHHFLIMIPSVYDHYETCLRRGTNPYRWVQYGVCASLLTGLVAIEVGLQSLFFIASLCAMQSVIMMLGYLAEREFRRSGDSAVPKAHYFIIVPAIFIWGTIIHSLQTVQVATADRGISFNEYSGQCVYIMFGLYFSFVFTQLAFFKFKIPYDAMETFYIIYGMMVETALGYYCIRAFFV